LLGIALGILLSKTQELPANFANSN